MLTGRKCRKFGNKVYPAGEQTGIVSLVRALRDETSNRSVYCSQLERVTVPSGGPSQT
jgi:hypothetical protein